MIKKFFLVVAILTTTAIVDVFVSNDKLVGCVAMAAAPNNGSYTKTSSSVSVYTESGHSKGSYPVYLHQGKRYISFNNTWICIQGKSRFSYCGNWYVIR
jgi:hypothetical protein